MADRLTLTIDGRQVSVPPGTTVLAAARLLGINIPTLCHLADLTPEGACRVCLVEADGVRGLAAACTLPAAAGMVVRTNTAAIREARALVVELLLANHPADCNACQRNLDCELQRLAADLGVRAVRFRGERRRYQPDDANPFIVRDNEKCVLCGRCVRVCKEVQVCNVLDWTERGFASKVTPAFDTALDGSACVFCGTCVSACPTGALAAKPLYEAGRPDKKVRTTCPFCGVGCNFDLNVKDGQVVGVTSDETSAVNGRLLCVKGRFGIDYVHSPDRLTAPLVKKDGAFVETSWDEALGLVAARLAGIKAAHGPDAIAALSSARCTNEENYLLQKFMRAVVGTNNIDHCART